MIFAEALRWEETWRGWVVTCTGSNTHRHPPRGCGGECSLER